MVSTLFIRFYSFLERTFITRESSNVSATQVQHELLHNIAFTIVLVKAYRILIEYWKTKHVNIKYILEIAVIAPIIIEVIFNYSSYDFNFIIFYGVFAVLSSIIYLFFYEKLV
ncbi:hypothetical protein BKN14_03490 [Candidatus Gracilibacteria bacterium HOT-871]|jgi:hypothetical protein|nr:hypothetical protein BKN14_03490 [Candidatus Gracilibacteria bacterium HOT-871]MBB1564723.1 hypothetical protein [Candidatus Gracilibacteria bacterium]MBF0913791.1 hypothetical protein [Candidatus Gracilibacteria bacterium]RKW20597.1 MAG: hypothetical protein D8B46_09295 [Candidatus Gracilibacteria bacterium]